MRSFRNAVIALSISALSLGAARTRGGSPSGSSSAAPGSSPRPGSTATATTANAGDPAAISLRGATIKPNAAPLVATYQSGKPDPGGYYYLTTFEITNTGTKDVKALSYKACLYDASGSLKGIPAQNAVDVAVKPNAKAPAEISYTAKNLGANHAVGLVIHGVHFADGTNWEDKMADCPSKL